MILVVVLLQIVARSEGAREQLIQSRRMVGHINSLLSFHLQRTQMMYLDFAGISKRAPERIAMLDHLAVNEVRIVDELANQTEENREHWLGITRAVKGLTAGFSLMRTKYREGDKVGAARILMRAQREMDNLYALIESTVSQESAREVRLQQEMTEYNELSSKILLSSLILSALIAILMVAVFNRNTAKRLNLLMENTQRMAAGQAPMEQIKGRDELAQIDNLYHRMHESLTVLRKHEKAMLANAAEAIVSIDQSLRFTNVNPATERIWGYSEEELLAKRVIEVIAGDEKQKVGDILSKAVGGDAEVRIETKAKRKDGELVDTSWSVSWSKEENSLYCVVQDISQRKELDRIKQEFFAMVNHDLRTPLTSIQMVLDWVEDEITDETSPPLVKSVKRAKESSKEMLGLINSLLEMEKIDSGMIELSKAPTDLSDLLSSAVQQVAGLAQDKNITLAENLIPASASVDAGRIKQVMTNLLGNAIKFSPRDSKITAILEKGDDGFKISIKDEGMGIKSHELPYVFERFKQATSDEQRRKKGFGLGLSICKAIVEAHGGQIGVESVEGEGSCFSFTLPSA